MNEIDEWFLPRAELEALAGEFLPESCLVLISMVNEILRDNTCPGLDISK